jgi:hypothetical protein
MAVGPPDYGDFGGLRANLQCPCAETVSVVLPGYMLDELRREDMTLVYIHPFILL